jgi:hypothetical protein
MQKHLEVAAVVGVAAAVAVPSASANYPDYARAAVPRTFVVRELVAEPNGFDWSDAGVGAATAVGGCLFVAGSALAMRRGRGREAVA